MRLTVFIHLLVAIITIDLVLSIACVGKQPASDTGDPGFPLGPSTTPAAPIAYVWALDSNALAVGLSHHFTPLLLAYASYRWYDQHGLFFYAPEYVGNPQFFTADYRLIPFSSSTYTARLVLTPRGGFWRFPDGTGLSIQYDRYRANTGFEAAIVSTGLRVPF